VVFPNCRRTGSAQWAELAPATQRRRGRIINRFRERHGKKWVALLRPEHVEKLLAEVSGAAPKRDWLKAIRGFLHFAVPTMLRTDPTQGLSVKLPKSKSHHDWTDAEIEQYRAYWPLGTQEGLVMEIALDTASRRGEVVRLGPQHVKDGWIKIERTPIWRSHRRARIWSAACRRR
jgi:hypothetical protein